ncbi:MAG: peptide-methionine (S)-S-oxide reductase MsrA [Candidatus Kapaibacterium sp.]
MIKRIIFIFALLIGTTACTNADEKTNHVEKEIMSSIVDTAIFASGCFWCTEAIFQELNGVDKVESGYIGGEKPNPTYEEVCSGNTGHAEATRIYYNPEIITFKELLEVFWKTHDPTTLNRQGNDVGTQYRSGIFYLSEDQKNLAEEYKKKLNDAGIYENPIVTEITPTSEFFVAENYHQNYYNQNGNQPYCSFVITPKIEKFKKVFEDKLKK